MKVFQERARRWRFALRWCSKMPNEMSDDEVWVLIICGFATVAEVVRWYRLLGRVDALSGLATHRLALAATWIANLVMVFVVLRTWSSHEVKQDSRYVALFMLAGAVWMFFAVEVLLPAFGISIRDDAVEGRNPAAVITICGWLTGIMLCYAGGNMGEGPTIWTTLIPAAWAAIALGTVWVTMDAVASISEEILLERDTAAACRMAAFLVAGGAILGRAVAGNFVSYEQTMRDLVRDGWPVIGLAALACAIHIRLRPTPERFTRSLWWSGLIPGGVYLTVAAMWILSRGAW